MAKVNTVVPQVSSWIGLKDFVRAAFSGPAPFTCARTEWQFLCEYRETARHWAVWALAAAACQLLLFIAVPPLLNHSYNAGAIAVRSCIALLLVACAVLFMVGPAIVVRHYVVVAGATSSLAFSLILAVMILPSLGSTTDSPSPLPALMFGLFLHYSYLRLPLTVAATIGWAVSTVVLLAAPMVVGGPTHFRTVVFLLMTNIMGMILCRSIEARERELYLQRSRAEAANADSRQRALAAEQANEAKARLIAAVSHDLRQPMMAAITHLEVMRAKQERNEQVPARTHAALVSESLSSLSATLDHLLTAARYEGATAPVNIQSVDLRSIFFEMKDLFGNVADDNGVELRIEPPDEIVGVVTDRQAILRVLSNVLSNSVKFTSVKSFGARIVRLRAQVADNYCKVVISDTGIGISKENLKRIWEPYFQVDNLERNRARGVGLGLYLVATIIDRLPQHSISLSSKLGRGSCTSIRLPAIPTYTVVPPVRGHLSREDLETLRGAHVVLIEDDQAVRFALESLLTEWGVGVTSGVSFEVVMLEPAIRERAIDAVITDYRLPMNKCGLDCVRELRALAGADLPAVMFTGEADPQDIKTDLLKDIVLLQKPFDPHALAAPLLKAVNAARAREAQC
jgi:signal transduction histidine kinase/CheY-like chemotaxis protein